jgi:hypothetical protein
MKKHKTRPIEGLYIDRPSLLGSVDELTQVEVMGFLCA